MVTGKTKENILISGHYSCQHHPAAKHYFVKDDHFPHCSMDSTHETIWTLNEANQKEQASFTENKTEDNGQEHFHAAGPETSPVEKNAQKEINLEDLYKKKGFYAALNHKSFPDLEEYKLVNVLRSEEQALQDEIAEIKRSRLERLTLAKKELDNIQQLITEKQQLKTEFGGELDRMQAEYETIKDEIHTYYTQLREEIKGLGTSKEDLVNKRIDKFKEEIDKIVAIYQGVEETQNTKFKKDFGDRDILQKDKEFYYDYRTKLTDTFSAVHTKVEALEKEGLNRLIAKFLIGIGWIAAFTSSWLFELWYSGKGGSSSGLLIYTLDNLRNFVLHYGWAMAILTFMGYITAVMIIAWGCYIWARKAKFAGFTKGKKDKGKNEDTIEFTPDKDVLIKSQFKATNWFEMWLKLAPFLAIMLLLVIILALGSKFSAGDNTYEGLSSSLSIQVIGFLLPVSCTVLIFLYITRVIESRVDEQKNKTRFSWEIILALVFFLVLIALFIANYFNIPWLSFNHTGAWGFFIGCICTGLALGYGYRFLSLNESHDILVEKIHAVNRYIERSFYPFKASYTKDGATLYRMKQLYHSLLDLVESKNNLAIKLLNPGYEPGNSQEKDQENKVQHQVTEEEVENEEEETGHPDKHNYVRFVAKKIIAFFYAREKKLKEKIREKEQQVQKLEDELKELKNDTIGVDEFTYFPEAGAKIKELKTLIDERSKRLKELKEELDGYYRNEKTYASLNQQLENLYIKQSGIAKTIETMETEVLQKQKQLSHEFIQRKIWIEEGYQLGLWFNGNHTGDHLFN